jgi:hypothetical protein
VARLVITQTENTIATKSAKMRKEKHDFNEAGSCRVALATPGFGFFLCLFVPFCGWSFQCV